MSDGTLSFKQGAHLRGRYNTDVPVCFIRGQSPAGCALEVPFHDQEGFVYFFDGAGFFAYGRGNSGYTHGAAFKFVNNSGQDAVIHFVEAVFVHIESGEAETSNFLIDHAGAFDLGEVADAAQQGIGNTRCAPAAPGDFVRAFRCNRNI